MDKNIIYATSNPGKIIEIRRHFNLHNLNVSSLSDFISIKLDPEETGASLGENALIKAKAYADAISRDSGMRGKTFVVLADDTGIEISGLNGEPGIRVRRWVGRKMTDEEIISYTIERMKGLVGEDRRARFKTVLCMIKIDGGGTIHKPVMSEGTLDGSILEIPNEMRIPGFPFESLFFVDEYKMLLGDLHNLSDKDKSKGLFNHRERAIEKAIPIIMGMLDS